MTLAIYAQTTDGMQDSATAAAGEGPFLDPAVDTPVAQASGNAARALSFFCYLQDFKKWRDPYTNLRPRS